MDADAFNAEPGHFRDRYFADGKSTYVFSHLDLRKSDYPELVEAVIRGANNDLRDRLLTVLIVIWRLRNSRLA